MKILAAVDRSPVSDKVLAFTRSVTGQQASEVLLINVAPAEPDVFGQQVRRKVITDPVPPELRDRRELLDRHAASLKEAGIACETLLVRGDPAPTLLREARRWGASLIIMGSHGRGALYRRFVGSVSEAVLRSRRFPVLIVPAQKEKDPQQ